MCSNCGSGFAGFMSPHHIDLPSREESKNCHLTKSWRGGGEVGGAHYYLGQQEDGGQLKPHVMNIQTPLKQYSSYSDSGIMQEG